MSKRETLTENMRRLSDIVNEAEQVNEIDFDLRNPRDALKTGAEAFGRELGKAAKTVFSKKPKIPPVAQEITARIIDEVIDSVPVETAVKIDRMNRMGLSRDAQVKLMQIANSYLDEVDYYDYVDKKAVSRARRDMGKLLKMTFDADIKPKEISNLMLKILRGWEVDLKLPPNFTKELYRKAIYTYQERIEEFDDKIALIGNVIILYHFAAVVTGITIWQIMDQHSPRNQEIRKGARDQGFLFYSPDDDAPLSQGEQGYRDQNLLWGDDNDDPNKY